MAERGDNISEVIDLLETLFSKNKELEPFPQKELNRDISISDSDYVKYRYWDGSRRGIK